MRIARTSGEQPLGAVDPVVGRGITGIGEIDPAEHLRTPDASLPVPPSPHHRSSVSAAGGLSRSRRQPLVSGYDNTSKFIVSIMANIMLIT